MKTDKCKTETYVLTELEKLDAVTVYVSNYAKGMGKIVIECYGQAWSCYWGGMGEQTLQQFVLGADNDYLLDKMLKETSRTDFEKLNNDARKRGFDICVTSDFEMAMCSKQLAECFGNEWFRDIPQCESEDYHYLNRILNAVKAAFSNEIESAAANTTTG